MNFFLNEGFRSVNSGVEHAERYRLAIFDELKEESRLVLTELLPKLPTDLEQWQIPVNKVINLFDFLMADSPDDYLKHGLVVDDLVEFKETALLDDSGMRRLVTEQAMAGYQIKRRKDCFPDDTNQQTVVRDAHVELTRGCRRLSWSYQKEGHHLKMTAIHLENFLGKNKYFQNFEQLLAFFMAAIQDCFGASRYFIDRGLAYHEYFVNHEKQYENDYLATVIHANHRVAMAGDRPIFNQFYQYPIQHLDVYDALICSTFLQAHDLKEDLQQTGANEASLNKILTLPVAFCLPSRQQQQQQKGQIDTAKGETLHLVTASRLHQEKHLDELLLALSRLKEAGLAVTLTIFGEGPEKATLQDLVRDEELEDQVTFAGWSRQLTDDLASFDLYLSTSYSEGFGLTYLEALGQGLPLVSYANRYGAEELIQDGQNGLLVPFIKGKEPAVRKRNAKQLAAAVLQAADRLNELTAHSRESIKAYDLTPVASTWQTLLEDWHEG